MHANVEFAQKVALAYGAVCKPLCRELGLTQTAFDILLFLANNPSYRTARDIVEVRHIKANLVSVNVGDRRKTALACTPGAQEVIRRGRQLQTAFFDSLFRGMEPPLRTAFIDAMQIIDRNLDQLLREER